MLHPSEPEGAVRLTVDEATPQAGHLPLPPASRIPPTIGGPPLWLPARWRQPAVGYVAAALLQALAVLATWFLTQAFPAFNFPSALPLLVVAFVALSWGSGPSILALLLGAVFIDYFLLVPGFSWAVRGNDLIGLAVFLLVGLLISRLASLHKRVRSAAETLAESLENERARLQATFEAIPDSITFYDAQGTLVSANPAGLQSIGSRPLPASLEAMPGAYRVRTPQGDPLPVEQLPVARALRGEMVNGVEVVTSGPDGNDRILIGGAAPIRSRQGQIVGVVATSHDVTALRRAEQEAARQRRQLQALLALTDTALTHLSLDELLRELLALLREVMGLDNAAILLLNEAEQMLHMRAAHGLEEEVAANIHVPVGQGFAGRIAASRQPLIVEDLSTFHTYNLFLQEKLRSVAGVPLLVGERVLGVAHVGTAAPHQFTEEEVQLLQRAADRIALAVDRAALYSAAGQARSEAEQRAGQLEAVFNSMTDGLVVFDAQGALLQMNGAARSLLSLERVADYSLEQASPGSSRFSIRDEQGRPLMQQEWPISRILQGETLTGANAVDLLLRSLDGHEIQVSVSGAPVRDEQGAIAGAISVIHDVTERRRLERRTQESLQALLDMAQTLVQEPGEAALTEQNSLALRVIARRLAELTCRVIGGQRTAFYSFDSETEQFRPLAVVGLSPEQEQQWLADPGRGHRPGENLPPALARCFLAGEVIVVDMREPPLRDLPNPYQVRNLIAAPLLVGQRLVGQFILDFGPELHDFTPQEIALAEAVGKLAALVIDRDRLLREREEARASALALREANRRMDEFLGIASHELRTPITKVKTSMQLAEHRAKTAVRQDNANGALLAKTLQPIQEMIGRGVRSVDVVNRLVSDLLDVSRIQADRLEMRPVPVDLIQVVREVVEEQRELFPHRTITLTAPERDARAAGESAETRWQPASDQRERECGNPVPARAAPRSGPQAALPAGDGPVQVTADAERIAQVVINFLTNALKYSPEALPVEVGVQVDERAARVWVRDQGPGIPADAQALLWERFYQVQGVAVQQGSSVGLGLGLYISRTIIERHGGQIGVESAPGKGATFWFTLPLAGEGSL